MPVNTTVTKPVLSNDGKYIIASNGIFVYTPKNGATAGFFTL